MADTNHHDDEKQQRYQDLVRRRKSCRLCNDLINPSDVCGGRFDPDHIGPWSRWQGNINATIVVIGQDWGTPQIFERAKGLEPFCSEADKGANGTLVDLLGSIGIKIERPKGHETIGKLFFTNAILCLKQGDAQAPVNSEWFDACGKTFIRPLLEILDPPVVISLGEKAYRALEKSYCLEKRSFRHAVNIPKGIPLFKNTRLFPMYHCGRRILNTHRNINEQQSDWARVGTFLQEHKVNVS